MTLDATVPVPVSPALRVTETNDLELKITVTDLYYLHHNASTPEWPKSLPLEAEQY